MPARRADDNRYTLATNATATGAAVSIKGGEYVLFVNCTTNLGNISLQAQSPSGAWIDIQVFAGSFVKTALTTLCMVDLLLPACSVRIAADGTVTGMNAFLVGAG
jgi:hypothetical protein